MQNLTQGIYGKTRFPFYSHYVETDKGFRGVPYPRDKWVSLIPSSFSQQDALLISKDGEVKVIGPGGLKYAPNADALEAIQKEGALFSSQSTKWSADKAIKEINAGHLIVKLHRKSHITVSQGNHTFSISGRINDVAIAKSVMAVASKTDLSFYQIKPNGTGLSLLTKLKGSGYSFVSFSADTTHLYLLKRTELIIFKGDHPKATSHWTDRSRCWFVARVVGFVAGITILGAAFGFAIANIVTTNVIAVWAVAAVTSAVFAAISHRIYQDYDDW